MVQKEKCDSIVNIRNIASFLYFVLMKLNLTFWQTHIDEALSKEGLSITARYSELATSLPIFLLDGSLNKYSEAKPLLRHWAGKATTSPKQVGQSSFLGLSSDSIARAFREDRSKQVELIDLLSYFVFEKGIIQAFETYGIKLGLNEGNIKVIKLRLKKMEEIENYFHPFVEDKFFEHHKESINLFKKLAERSSQQIEYSTISMSWQEILDSVLVECNGFQQYVELNWSVIERRLRKNQDIFRAQYGRIKGTNKRILIGFYIIYPISEGLVNLLDAGLVNSAEKPAFLDECILPSFSHPDVRALYISTVFSFSYPEIEFGANLVAELKRTIDLYKELFPNILFVYTKPRTDQGKKIVSGRGFTRLFPNNDNNLIQVAKL